MAKPENVKLEVLENHMTRRNGRRDLVMWRYNTDGTVLKELIYEDIPTGRAETSMRAAERVLRMIGYNVFK